MRKKFKHLINYLAFLLAALSFAAGTILLLAFKLTNEPGLMVLGYFHLPGATIVNTVMLVILICNTAVHWKDYKENLLTILSMLLNIPIATFYQEIL